MPNCEWLDDGTLRVWASNVSDNCRFRNLGADGDRASVAVVPGKGQPGVLQDVGGEEFEPLFVDIAKIHEDLNNLPPALGDD